MGGKGIKVTDNLDTISEPTNAIVCPYLQNNNYASDIFPYSLNTIRVLSCVIDNKIEILGAVHRFGSSNSKQKFVDSFSQGGITAYIDVETGEITKACRLYLNKRQNIEIHPDTEKKS